MAEKSNNFPIRNKEKISKDLAIRDMPGKLGKGKKIPKKRLRPSPLQSKKVIRVLIWSGLVLLEVGISYTIVNQLLISDEIVDTETASNAGISSNENVNSKEEKSSISGISAGQQNFSEIGGLYTLSDVVVNPAFSQGRRFFVVSTVFAFDEGRMVQLAEEREPILRDRIITLLTRKSLNWLSNYANKEILRGEMLEITKEVLECPEGIYIYFTKYVLQ